MHAHTTTYSGKFQPDEEYSFHPKLKAWLIEYWNLTSDELVDIQEFGCDDNNCPVFETLITAKDSSDQSKTRILKLGKPKENITKQDLILSIRKQVGK
ncbi:hypothetical protein [Leptospira sp. GIMC2001]|uniref:hypothetical protein n=1 Tax=Leptospira sp. GIMC2001 TaxID=1513297 RepID=UPI00234A8F6F|nr:hypothetical protein [Leptospira sp. GIMC2001]WCL47660.1 hypothetical protein O4O04_01445 [Leptospira sp. GIMC2001]